MLDPADVLVDREPVVRHRAVERRGVVPRIGVAKEVPGRVDERVHRVGLSPRLPVARRTRGAHPVLRRRQRRAALREILGHLGEQHRQVVVRDRHDAAPVAVHDRDRAAPVPLAGEQPVTQAVPDPKRPTALAREPVDDPLRPSGAGRPLKSPELTSTSSSECATKAPWVATGSPPWAGATTVRIGRLHAARTRSRARRAQGRP